jgi:hypothetical protein
MTDPAIVPARTGDVLWFLDTLMEVKVGEHDVVVVGPPPPAT